MYKNTPLKEVIFRVDFERISLSKIKDFSEKAIAFFENESYKSLLSDVVNITNIKWVHDTKVEKVKTHEYSYSNSQESNTLKITNESFILRYLEYENHDRLFEHLELLNDFINQFELKTINRLGLRYINSIEDFEVEKEYINECFYGTLKFFSEDKDKLARNMWKIIKKEWQGNLEINYGIWNNDFPSTIKKWDFILDFDCSTKTPLVLSDDSAVDITKEFHSIIIENFERIITQKYRDFLNT